MTDTSAAPAREVDTVEALLRSKTHSVPPEESEARKQEFDRAEKTHRGISWPRWRSTPKAT